MKESACCKIALRGTRIISVPGDLRNWCGLGGVVRRRRCKAAPRQSANARIRGTLLGMGPHRRDVLRDLLCDLDATFPAASLACPEHSFRPVGENDVYQCFLELPLLSSTPSSIRLPNWGAVWRYGAGAVFPPVKTRRHSGLVPLAVSDLFDLRESLGVSRLEAQSKLVRHLSLAIDTHPL